MSFLLDTHALLWWFFDAERLSSRSRDLIDDTSNDVFVSAVSSLEIATKFRIGKLPGAKPLVGRFVEAIDAEGFSALAIDARHAELAGGFSFPHNDPWDRLLAAQAKIEGLTLVTNDAKLARFGVATCW